MHKSWSAIPIMLVFRFATAGAACVSPSGVSGQLTWIPGISKVQWCDGADWHDTTNATGSSCSGTTAGTINYASGDLRYCDGSNWISMKGLVAGSCSGTTAGTYAYNSSVYQFCDGSNWYSMSAPSGPAYDWNFTSLTSVPSELTFSRASVATYYDSSGILQTASSGVARFDYDPVTLSKKGLLLEPSVTNYAQYGSALTNTSGWGPYKATIATTTATTSPDGTTDAFVLNDGTASNIQHNIGANVAIPYVANTVVTGSWFVKNGTRQYAIAGIQDTGSNSGIDCIFDLVGGTATATDGWGSNGGNPTCSIQSVGNGWYRISVTGIPTTTLTSIQLYAAMSSGASAASSIYTGSSKTIYLYGPQLETGSIMTSYIPTTAGATVTRAADQLTFNTMSGFSSTSGTLFAQFINAAFENTQTYRIFGFFKTNVAGTFAQNEIALADKGTTNQSEVSSGGTAQFSPSGGTLNAAGSVNKMAMSYQAANFAYALNGGTAVTQASGSLPSSLAYGYVGSQPDGNIRSRWIQKIKYYASRMTGTELQDLTSTAPKQIYLTLGTSWTVPDDWNNSNNTIEVIGGGGGGGRGGPDWAGTGGGGGAYTKIVNLALSPGSVTYQIGSGGAPGTSASANGQAGGDTFFNGSGSTCADSSPSACAKGGSGGKGNFKGTGVKGGLSSGAVVTGSGSVVFSGGSAGSNGDNTGGGSGGGGAAGLSGNGANGGNNYTSDTNTATVGGAGGGGANGGGAGVKTVEGASNGGNGGTGPTGTAGGAGSTSTATAGGSGSNGSGGGGGKGASTSGSVGGAGGAGVDFDATHGSGGGGGGGGGNSGFGGSAKVGGAGGLYGGGGGGGGWQDSVGPSGGAGAQGLIVITYTP